MKRSKPTTEETRPPHRPTKYHSRYCKLIIAAAREGKNLTIFADEIDVHRDTLYEWAKHHREFSDAMKHARQACEAFMMKIGMLGMGGQTKNFGQATWIFWMKAQFRWRDDGLSDDNDPVDGIEFT